MCFRLCVVCDSVAWPGVQRYLSQKAEDVVVTVLELSLFVELINTTNVPKYGKAVNRLRDRVKS